MYKREFERDTGMNSTGHSNNSFNKPQRVVGRTGIPQFHLTLHFFADSKKKRTYQKLNLHHLGLVATRDGSAAGGSTVEPADRVLGCLNPSRVQ